MYFKSYSNLIWFAFGFKFGNKMEKIWKKKENDFFLSPSSLSACWPSTGSFSSAPAHPLRPSSRDVGRSQLPSARSNRPSKAAPAEATTAAQLSSSRAAPSLSYPLTRRARLVRPSSPSRSPIGLHRRLSCPRRPHLHPVPCLSS